MRSGWATRPLRTLWSGRHREGHENVAGLLTADDLLARLGTVTTDSDARALVRRAARIAGVPADRPLEIDELLRVCEALASEGGMIQHVAELIASRAIDH